MLSDAQALRFMSREEFNTFPTSAVFGMSTPGYAIAINSPSLKYKIFKVKDDEVLVIFKQVNMFKVHYKRLLGFPISKKGDVKLEKAIFKKLCTLDDVTEMQLLESDAILHGLDTSKLEYENVEFFVNPKELSPTMNGKYRQRYQISKFVDDLVYRDATPDDFENIISLLNRWMQFKDDGEGVHSKPIYKNVIKNSNKYLLGDYTTKVLYYKDELFAFSVNYVTDSKVYQITNIVDTFSDTFPKHLVKGGNRIPFYYLVKSFEDYEYISFMGSINPKSNVFKNKELVYKTYEKFYRIKLKK